MKRCIFLILIGVMCVNPLLAQEKGPAPTAARKNLSDHLKKVPPGWLTYYEGATLDSIQKHYNFAYLIDMVERHQALIEVLAKKVVALEAQVAALTPPVDPNDQPVGEATDPNDSK